jgi:hypothetical protein
MLRKPQKGGPMALLGQGALAMWWDMAPEHRTEFEDWHTHEHFPERMGIPGFLRGSRWAAADGGEGFFVLYEMQGYDTLVSPGYLARLNAPSPWSTRMMPHHRNMVRSLCRARAGFGGGLGQAMATVRFSPGERGALPELGPRDGVTGMSLLESQPMGGPPTIEQKIRGGDAQADWVLLVCGYDVDAVRAAAGQYRALPGAVEGLYRLSYSMTPKDLPR